MSFQKQINYIIKFHEKDKSSFIPIDNIKQYIWPIPDLNRSVSQTSNLLSALDEVDNEISLEKLIALDEFITREINK